MKRMAVIVDYQNVMLMGHKIFVPKSPLHECVIDPYAFACQIARVRNAKLPDGDEPCEVARVEVYRGCPSQERNPRGYASNQAQLSRWTRGKRGIVEVEYRTLKYYPDGAIQEKGVDVLCALALVRAARSGLYDVVVLASRDTDLEPALDEANMVRSGGTKIEAVKWYDPEVKSTNGRFKPKTPIWTTNLCESEYLASLEQAP